MSHPRPVLAVALVLISVLAAGGCADDRPHTHGKAFVMRATWEPVPGTVEAVSGVVVHVAGVDPAPGIARAVRCSLRPDAFTAQLQETFGALLPRRVRFHLHDRASGRTWRTPWRDRPDADRPDDLRTGRTTWTVVAAAPGLAPTADRERRAGDCRAELEHRLPPG